MSEQQNDPVRGGIYMALAMLAFAITDTIIKFIGPEMLLGQLLFVRGVFSVLIIGVMCWYTNVLGSVGKLFSRPVAIRAVADLATTYLFVNALLHLPLANANAILQAVPFVVMVLAMVFLGERVGWRRLVAVAIGFAGVMLIVKPGGDSFDVYSLYAVGALITVSIRDLITRRIPFNTPSMIVALANALTISAGGLVYALFEGFQPMSLQQVGFLWGSAMAVAAAYTFTVMTLRTADVASTAPMRYTVIMWTLLAGYLVFGDVPDRIAFVGIALIAASGLYAVNRERQLRNAGRSVTHVNKRYRW